MFSHYTSGNRGQQLFLCSFQCCSWQALPQYITPSHTAHRWDAGERHTMHDM